MLPPVLEVSDTPSIGSSHLIIKMELRNLIICVISEPSRHKIMLSFQFTSKIPVEKTYRKYVSTIIEYKMFLN